MTHIGELAVHLMSFQYRFYNLFRCEKLTNTHRGAIRCASRGTLHLLKLAVFGSRLRTFS